MIDYLKRNSEELGDKAAIICGEKSLTFRELYVLTKKKTLEIEKQTCDVIYIENVRSIETIVYMLAAAMANRTYRIIDREESISASEVFNESAKKTLYQVCTSGTTGEKKLISKDREEFFDFMRRYAEKLNISADDVILNQLEFTFDAASKDIYLMLITGATLCIGSRTELNFPAGFIETVEKNKVTIFQTTPYFIRNISRFDGFAEKKPTTLKKVMFVGDIMKTEYLNYWIKKLPKVTFVNLYGTSETIGSLMYHEVKEELCENTVPLTKTFKAYKPYINEEGILCFENQKGTDVVTDDVAVKKGAAFYIMGRADNIRKIRGYRVSLEETESLLTEKLGLAACLCEILEDELYVIFEAKKEYDVKKLQSDIRGCIPKYLQPVHLKQIDSMPSNVNGKMNRKKVAEYF